MVQSGNFIARGFCILVIAAATMSLLTLPAAAAEKGWFGFSVNVDADSMSPNPTLRTATVESVVPGSPAAKAGLVSGDQVLEVQGVPVAGAKADVFRAAMQKAVGESVRIKIKRGDAAAREVSLVAAHQPP